MKAVFLVLAVIGGTLTGGAFAGASSTSTGAGPGAAVIPPQWLAVCQAAGTATGTPWAILCAIGKQENGWQVPGVVSSAGAVGPMQFLPSTFAEVTADQAVPPGGADPWNAVDLTDSVYAAGYYLASLNVATDPTDALDHYSNDFTGSYAANVISMATSYTENGLLTAGGGLGGSVEAGALAAAITQLGVPYVWGGETPGEAFDCSGLAQWAYSTVGLAIPRTGQPQLDMGMLVSTMSPGDLVFFGAMPNVDDHVGIFVGYESDGSAEMIDAPNPSSVVRFDTFAPTVGADWGGEAFLGGTDPVMAASSRST